jgi:hypothetical protein
VRRDVNYRGIFYSIEPIGEHRLKWQIDPPTSVRGLYPQSGEIDGQEADAMTEAHKAIDLQSMRLLS